VGKDLKRLGLINVQKECKRGTAVNRDEGRGIDLLPHNRKTLPTYSTSGYAKKFVERT